MGQLSSFVSKGLLLLIMWGIIYCSEAICKSNEIQRGTPKKRTVSNWKNMFPHVCFFYVSIYVYIHTLLSMSIVLLAVYRFIAVFLIYCRDQQVVSRVVCILLGEIWPSLFLANGVLLVLDSIPCFLCKSCLPGLIDPCRLLVSPKVISCR